MKKATCKGRGGPMCPPVRRADTQVGPYRRPTIDNPKWVVVFSVIAFVLATMSGAAALAQQPTKIPRIANLIGSSPSADLARTEAFR
jgi:hypothetical protein